MLTPLLNLDGYNLFHEGSSAFTEIESKGISVDVAYLKRIYIQLSKQLLENDCSIWKTNEARIWKKTNGDKTNLDSTTQLSNLLYKQLKNKPTKMTRKGGIAVDDDALQRIKTPFSQAILRRRKLSKVRDTYITQLLETQVDGKLHPSFNLHLVQTFRSSCDHPNFQNIPIRDPEQGPIIRKAIIPSSPDLQICEIDYSGIEVRVAACYHKDPVMIEYICDPTKDMHRDMAAECFMVTPEQVSKVMRYCGKNGFVFPEFYGSYFVNVAPALWQMIDDYQLSVGKIPLKEYLKNKGINCCGKWSKSNSTGKWKIDRKDSFMEHIRKVEDRFWNERFFGYKSWKEDWYKAYLRKGWFDSFTGFRCCGPMRKNEVINYPIQGDAFHCLLWSIIEIHRWLTVNEMRSRILAQIHDSILFEIDPLEREKVLSKVKTIMCDKLRKHWPWIIVPLEVEIEISLPGATWNEKEKLVI